MNGQQPRGSRGVWGDWFVSPQKKWRALFFVFAIVGILGAIGWALLGDRLLVVRVVAVSGTRLVTPSQVVAAADVPVGTPLIRVDTGQVATRVAAIRQVASVRVSKDWPDGLSIAVTERVPVVAVRIASGEYDLVDHDGVIVVYSRTKPAAMPLFQTALPGSQLRGSPDVAAVSTVLAELPGWLSREVTDVGVAGGGDSVVLSLRGGETVVWGGPDRAGAKASELAILMRDRASYYDVSDPGTVVTR